jgi:hypothetical protein
MVIGVNDVRLVVKLPVVPVLTDFELAIVGFVVVLQHMPLSMTGLPPSLVTFPPLMALVALMPDASVVAANTGSPLAANPIMFVHAEPLYTCSSPKAPQLLHHMINPAGVGVAILPLSVAVILGGKKPLEVLFTSNAAATDGVEVPIPTCAIIPTEMKSMKLDKRYFIIRKMR